MSESRTPLRLAARRATLDEIRGMAWFNRLTPQGRVDWLRRAAREEGREFASAAEAWAAWKRSQGEDPAVSALGGVGASLRQKHTDS